jgi:DNA-binding protein H-NS
MKILNTKKLTKTIAFATLIPLSGLTVQAASHGHGPMQDRPMDREAMHERMQERMQDMHQRLEQMNQELEERLQELGQAEGEARIDAMEEAIRTLIAHRIDMHEHRIDLIDQMLEHMEQPPQRGREFGERPDPTPEGDEGEEASAEQP